MKNLIKELWYGNILPQEASQTNSEEMKELLSYITRHHEDLEKSFTDEQKAIFEKSKSNGYPRRFLTKLAIYNG